MVVFTETPMAVQAARVLRRSPTPPDFCACGCGGKLSAKVRAARYLHTEGFSFAEIGREIGATPKYARTIIRGSSTQRAPRFLPGHSARMNRWRTVECAWCGRNFRTCRQSAIVICNGRDECSLIRWLLHLYGDDAWQEILKKPVSSWSNISTKRWRDIVRTSRRNKPAFADAEFLQERVLWLERRAAKRDRQLEDKWIAKATRDHKREFTETAQRHMRAQRHAQRQIDAEARGEDSRGWGLFTYQASLDEPLFTLEGGNVVTRGDRLIGSADPSEELARDRLWEIVGDMKPEDIARMDDHALTRLQQRLLAEGLVDIKVTDSERERLRDPNPHSGASVPKIGRREGGKRTRKQQQQVTRDHHVRELPTQAKRQHQQRRKARRVNRITETGVDSQPPTRPQGDTSRRKEDATP